MTNITGETIEDIRLSARLRLQRDVGLLFQPDDDGGMEVIAFGGNRRWSVVERGDGEYDFIPRIG